jgi:hypothetical protein
MSLIIPNDRRKDMKPITEIEKTVVADALAHIEWILLGHVPDPTLELLQRLILLLDLPQPRRFQKFTCCWEPSRTTPRSSARLSEDECCVLVEWLSSLASLYGSNASPVAMEVSRKLQQELRSLPTRSPQWWREFDKEIISVGHMT